MSRRDTREPCGCRHNGTQWVEECDAHRAEHAELHRRAADERLILNCGKCGVAHAAGDKPGAQRFDLGPNLVVGFVLLADYLVIEHGLHFGSRCHSHLLLHDVAPPLRDARCACHQAQMRSMREASTSSTVACMSAL